jgi:hypothetical protein
MDVDLRCEALKMNSACSSETQAFIFISTYRYSPIENINVITAANAPDFTKRAGTERGKSAYGLC